MDWSLIDWHLVRQIAVDTWVVTVLVCAIAWMIAWTVGLVIRKTTKTIPEGKEGSAKDK